MKCLHHPGFALPGNLIGPGHIAAITGLTAGPYGGEFRQSLLQSMDRVVMGLVGQPG
jgi:hypothetical protein